MLADDDLKPIAAFVDSMKIVYASRDQKMHDVRAIRAGDFDTVAPELFSEAWPKPTVANLVDTFARDAAASLSPMPAVNCSSALTLKPAAQKFADKRTKIFNHYLKTSNLEARQIDFADSLNCYGLGVYRIVPDMKSKAPRILVEDGVSYYVVWNHRMEVVKSARMYKLDWNSVAALYPDDMDLVKSMKFGTEGSEVNVISYEDKKVCVTYLPDNGNVILEKYANPLGRPSVVAIPRPTGTGRWAAGEIKGAYDDLIWPQMARHQLQQYAIEAADKAVRAPLILPSDVTDVSIGPDAIMKTAQGANSVGRAKIDVPPAAFQAMQWLEKDMQSGSMTPESRTGQVSASVITGQGIEALSAGYSSQISSLQTIIKFALAQALDICAEMDEVMWPNLRREITGQDNGVPYSISYVPSKDIKGDHSVDIQYGAYAGLDPNRALVFILQAMSAELVSKDWARRNLPNGINAADEEQKIQIEGIRAALVASLGGVAQSIPQMALQGMDPTQSVMQIAAVVKGLQDGKKLEDLAVEVFAPKPPPEEAAPVGQPDLSQAPGSEQPSGGALGAPAETGAKPPLNMFMSGLSNSGQANLQANVSRMTPAA